MSSDNSNIYLTVWYYKVPTFTIITDPKWIYSTIQLLKMCKGYNPFTFLLKYLSLKEMFTNYKNSNPSISVIIMLFCLFFKAYHYLIYYSFMCSFIYHLSSCSRWYACGEHIFRCVHHKYTPGLSPRRWQ